MTRTPRLLLLLLPVLAGACDVPDPYRREGTWRPTAANEANLRAMVDRPADLAEGTGSTGATGQTSTAAVDRLRSDRVRPLPESSVSPLFNSGGNR